MVEVTSNRFHAMSAELASRIEKVIAEFGQEHGAIGFNAEAMARQSHQNLVQLSHDAMMFGLDIWAGEQIEEEDRPSNVVPFVVGSSRLSLARQSLSGSPVFSALS